MDNHQNQAVILSAVRTPIVEGIEDGRVPHLVRDGLVDFAAPLDPAVADARVVEALDGAVDEDRVVVVERVAARQFVAPTEAPGERDAGPVLVARCEQAARRAAPVLALVVPTGLMLGEP